MKAIKIIILLSATVNVLCGQTFENLFGSESTQWNMTVGNLWGTGSTEHHVIGDTVMDGKSYKIINGYDGQNDIMGFLRQDSLSQKAWYRNNQTDEEYLVMDLSLEVGDSLFVQGSWNGNHKYYVVDSVYSKNGRKHLRFDFPLDFLENKKFTLIEGIISNMGFRYQDNDYINGIPTILLCAYKNEKKIYGEGDCVISSVNEESASSNFILYPNPFSDILTSVMMDPTSKGLIEIVSMTGTLCFQKSGALSQYETMNVSNLDPGIYFIRIYDDQRGVVHTSKVVKSH